MDFMWPLGRCGPIRSRNLSLWSSVSQHSHQGCSNCNTTLTYRLRYSPFEMKSYLFVASLALGTECKGFPSSHFPGFCVDGDFSVGFRCGAKSFGFFILSLLTSVSFCEKPRNTGCNELPAWDFKPQGKNHGNSRN